MGLYGSPDLTNTNKTSNDNNMIYCMACGFKYSKKLKKCPRCGMKYAQPFYHKWWFWLFILIMVCSFSLPRNDNEVTETQSSQKVQTGGTPNEPIKQSIVSEEDYKAGCASIPYVDIARNPNNYIGQKAVFKGKVAQVEESGKYVVLRLDVTEDEYGFWDDTVYVDYCRKSDVESRILEDDIITIYGEIKGIKNYTAVLGNQVSIPHLVAEYVEIN